MIEEKKKELKESPFSGDDNFFKSTVMDDGGHLKEKEDLQKAIPTMQKTAKRVLKETKEMPKGFDKFKKKVEKNFSEIGSIIKEMVEQCDKPEQYGRLLEKWKELKSEFSWKVNDKIKGYANDMISENPDSNSEYNKNKIIID